ncbi:MAG: D-alanyl-D-alanine carboxypeptidase/D-alanyl-D-alanine-endopeptidase, partial [Catalinimonas sp.]
YYGAGAFGLNWDENRYRLTFAPGHAGQPAPLVGTDPPLPGLVFENRVLTGPVGSGDNAYIYGAPFSPFRYLGGTVPAGVRTFTIKGSLPDPAAVLGRQWLTALGARGIQVDSLRPRTHNAPPAAPRTTLHVHYSPPLRAIVRELNLHSVNLYAEALLKSVGRAEQAGGTTAAGLQILRRVWRERGLDLSRGYRQKDGSGLSTGNLLTAGLLADLCVQMAQEESFGAFKASLPVAGESGTLRNVGRRTAAAGNVRAKSGTLGGVICYAGYATTRSGEPLAFAVMVNHYEGGYRRMRARWERLMVQLAELP